MAQPEIITITNGTLTVGISTLGATVKSVKTSDGEEFIWQADPEYWAGSAPILFPVCGGLNGDTYRYNGTEYKLGRHGYIRFKQFEVVEHTDDEVLFLSRSDEQTLACYPFEYELYARFKLEGSSLVTTYSVKNMCKCEMYFSIGAHEGYALSYPLSDYTLEFDSEQQAPIYAECRGPIDDSSVLINESGASSFRFDTEQFRGESMVFHPVSARSITLKSSHDTKSVTVDLRDSDYLVFWTIPGAPFFCIEPWNGFSDPIGFCGEIRDKEGIITLDADGTYSTSHTITFNN